jgi:type IV pilus assembly protein PilY1
VRASASALSVEPFYEATNNGTDWYSKLRAFKLSVEPTTRKIVPEEAWEASAQMLRLHHAASGSGDGALEDFSAVSAWPICAPSRRCLRAS